MSAPMTELHSETRRWQDWATFALGLWLALSPWLADYTAHDVATANAAICGLALALVAHFGFSCDHLSTEWLTLGGGLWLIAAPFALGFASHHVATVNAMAVGVFIVLLSAWALELDRELGRLWHRLIAGH
jgi:SPW repeat-containing protein